MDSTWGGQAERPVTDARMMGAAVMLGLMRPLRDLHAGTLEV
jgi:hypothetical protein